MDNDQTGFHEWHKSQSSKVMFIDSKDATAVHNGTTHFTYVFRDTIMIERDEGILVSLLQASVPYSFYNVRHNVNNTIIVSYVDHAGVRDGGVYLYQHPMDARIRYQAYRLQRAEQLDSVACLCSRFHAKFCDGMHSLILLQHIHHQCLPSFCSLAVAGV